MKILLVQTSFLGDTILSTPVISGIKSRYPEADLWMMTTPLSADLVKSDPLLKGVISFDKRGKNKGVAGLLRMNRRLRSMAFDRAYSLHRSYRTSLLLWLARIPVRIGCADAKWRFLYHHIKARNFEHHDVIRNMSILAGEIDIDQKSMQMRLFAPDWSDINGDLREGLPSPGSYAVMAPGSAWRTKMWHWRGYREVARRFLDWGIHVILLGAESDRRVCARIAEKTPVIDLSGRTRISEVMTIVQNARLMICNDSMSLHMASAMKIPTVAIFCATSPSFGYGPWQNKAIVIEQQNLDCKPCRRHGSLRCPNGTEACMRGPGPELVIAAARKLLDEKRACGEIETARMNHRKAK